MTILDISAGNRYMWKNKNPPNTIFLDKRGPELNIPPDIIASWTHLPIRDNCIKLVIWDPPHLIHKDTGITLFKKYGQYNRKRDLVLSILYGAKETRRISKRLCFKWNEQNYPLYKIRALLIPWKQIHTTKPKHRAQRRRRIHPLTTWITLI
jgi:hypothetical protein